MNNVVKNTMLKWWLDLICPHTCMNCGELGEILCDCCKNNITTKQKNICPICKKMLKSGQNKCEDCEIPFLAMFVVGWREGVLARLTKEYKYKSLRAAGDILADLVVARMRDELEKVLDGLEDRLDDDCGSDLNDDFEGNFGGDLMGKVGGNSRGIVVVPLPTIGKHIRQRGFDHTADLAKKIAVRKGWEYEELLGRATNTVQVGASMEKRKEQAERTYYVKRQVESGKMYVLVDDVWTSGASMLAAASVLVEAGAEKMAGVVVMTGKPEMEKPQVN